MHLEKKTYPGPD